MKFILMSALCFFITVNAFSTEGIEGGFVDKSTSAQMLLASTLDMFSIATKKYEKGEITKDQYLKLALQVNKVSEIAKSLKVAEQNTSKPSLYTSLQDTNKEANSKIKADYQAYLKSTKINDVRDWGNGKLYRRAYGALYVDNYNGDSVFLHDMANEDLDYQRIAEINPSIRKFWNDKYGFQLYVENIDIHLSSDVKSSEFKTGVKISSWIQENNKSLKISHSKKWNGMTIIRTSNPGCLMILSKDGVDTASVCESDNFEKTLPDNPFLSKIAAEHWGYAATSK